MRIDIAIMTSLIFFTSGWQGASAQEFLQPIKSDASFLSNTGRTEPQLPLTSTALLAPGSVSDIAIAGVPASTGECAAESQSVNNQIRGYTGTALPAVSTAAVGINTVDCPFIGANVDGSDGWVYIAGRIINGQVRPWVNLKQTALEAASFIRKSK